MIFLLCAEDFLFKFGGFVAIPDPEYEGQNDANRNDGYDNNVIFAEVSGLKFWLRFHAANVESGGRGIQISGVTLTFPERNNYISGRNKTISILNIN